MFAEADKKCDTDAVTSEVASGVTGSRTGVDGYIGID